MRHSALNKSKTATILMLMMLAACAPPTTSPASTPTAADTATVRVVPTQTVPAQVSRPQPTTQQPSCIGCEAPADMISAATHTPVVSGTESAGLCPVLSLAGEGCLNEAGVIREDAGITGSDGNQTPFQIYLPPGYDDRAEGGYPVLYLLHGSNQTEDAWFGMGLASAADRLIQSGLVKPFIMVTPRETAVSLLVPDSAFGSDLVEGLVPYIDENYNTCTQRACRAIGGLSRGGQWALRIGLTHWQTFGAIGVHSNPGGHENLSVWLREMAADERPRLYVDTGAEDYYRAAAFDLEERLMANAYVHTWVLNNGTHDTAYWRAHLHEYLEWYTLPWRVE